MLGEVDVTGNNRVDFDEFLRLMNVEEDYDFYRAQSM